MLLNILKNYKIILGSQSPRRKHLLEELGLEFEVTPAKSFDETYPKDLDRDEISSHLAKLKSLVFKDYLKNDTILITADTIVWLKNKVIGKPETFNDAVNILKKLSGNCHQVITGVCITDLNKQVTFSSKTDVFFKELSLEEIQYYIKKYKPFDKAGAYGIQEWIGYIGIKKIIGSFYNVMGLPIQKLYCELERFCEK